MQLLELTIPKIRVIKIKLCKKVMIVEHLTNLISLAFISSGNLDLSLRYVITPKLTFPMFVSPKLYMTFQSNEIVFPAVIINSMM